MTARGALDKPVASRARRVPRASCPRVPRASCPRLVALSPLLLALAAGCDPAGMRAPALEDRADRVLLEVAPAPINRDDAPAPDGIEVRAFFWQEPGPRAVAVSGTVTFLLYRGRVGPAGLDDAKPDRKSVV